MSPATARSAALAAVLACAPAMPTTRLYRLQPPAPTACAATPRGSLRVRDMQVASAYDDARIAYRESAYQLRRYEYHQWAAPPGELVSDALRDGYAASGCFARVGRDHDAPADAELHGRVLALEEVDVTRTQWSAHLRIELDLRDARTHRRLWSHEYDLSRPLQPRSPDGLAAATSAALREVVDASASALATATSAASAAARDDGHPGALP